jgi:hypothetical protein
VFVAVGGLGTILGMIEEVLNVEIMRCDEEKKE